MQGTETTKKKRTAAMIRELFRDAPEGTHRSKLIDAAYEIVAAADADAPARLLLADAAELITAAETETRTARERGRRALPAGGLDTRPAGTCDRCRVNEARAALARFMNTWTTKTGAPYPEGIRRAIRSI